MKNNQFTFILVGVLFLVTLGTAVLGLKYNSSIKGFQAADSRHKKFVNSQIILNRLAGDIAEYSKKDPGINAMLESFASANSNPAGVLPKPQAK